MIEFEVSLPLSNGKFQFKGTVKAYTKRSARHEAKRRFGPNSKYEIVEKQKVQQIGEQK